MSKGIFWCDYSGSWIRFIINKENGLIHAESATRRVDAPNLTSDWQLDDSHDLWVINYIDEDDTPVIIGFRLINGILYRTDFSLNRLTNELYFTQFNNGEFIQTRQNIKPFAPLSQQNQPTPFAKLPLTPEALTNKWNRWKHDFSDKHVNFKKFSSFDLNQNALLRAEMNVLLLPLLSLTSVDDYQLALVDALSNPGGEMNKHIMSFAAKTDLDRELNLNPAKSEEIRNDLFQLKQSFAYGFINNELNQVTSAFHLQPIKYQLAPLKKLQEKNRHNPREFTHENTAAAVEEAVNKYSQWYEKGTPFRGPNGFFTFFRHGKEGQMRAQQLLNGINNSIGDAQHHASLINSFLTADSTRFHRHSFASFLLDELAQLLDRTWANFQNHDGNLYDKQEVITRLNNSL